jgi:hypothetical protein
MEDSKSRKRDNNHDRADRDHHFPDRMSVKPGIQHDEIPFGGALTSRSND